MTNQSATTHLCCSFGGRLIVVDPLLLLVEHVGHDPRTVASRNLAHLADGRREACELVAHHDGRAPLTAVLQAQEHRLRQPEHVRREDAVAPPRAVVRKE